MTRSWSDVVAGEWLRGMLAQLRSPQTDDGCQPGRDLQATLRPYQVEGVRWLWLVTQLALGVCLADDMGLGKTIQAIDLLLQHRRAAGENRFPPSLLVVPASLLGNRSSELSRFAPSLKFLMLHRSECDAVTLERIAARPQQLLTDYDLIVTTYSLVRRQTWLAGIAWSLVILDEAQAIKNASSSQAKSVKALSATARLALTGTPVENHPGDLWSLFGFACPGLLGNASAFKKPAYLIGASNHPASARRANARGRASRCRKLQCSAARVRPQVQRVLPVGLPPPHRHRVPP